MAGFESNSRFLYALLCELSDCLCKSIDFGRLPGHRMVIINLVNLRRLGVKISCVLFSSILQIRISQAMHMQCWNPNPFLGWVHGYLGFSETISMSEVVERRCSEHTHGLFASITENTKLQTKCFV